MIDRRSAVFLDYDGTLADIAEMPHLATAPDDMADILTRLSAVLDGAVAILSGRPLSEIDAMLHPFTGAAAGVHGAERRIGDGAAVPPEAREALSRVARAAEDLAAAHEGVLIERKSAAVAVHFRRNPTAEMACRAALREAVAGDERLALTEGKMVLEVRLKGHDKGAALDWFMARAPFAGRRPLVIGDDVTDEDAFRAALRMGGDAVKVGDGETAAPHRLPDPAAVRRLLAAALETLERPA